MTHRLFASASDAGDRPAIVDGDSRFTYRDLLSAAGLIREDLLAGPDDLNEERIAYLVPAGFDYVATLFGIWSAGGVAVPLCLKHPLPELDYVVGDTGATQLIAAEEFRDTARELATTSHLRLRMADEVLDQALSRPGPELPSVDPPRRAMILYTSGSTGKPKGVVATHASIASQVECLVTAWEWTSTDRILHVLPLHHVHGIVNVLLCALRAGAVCEFAHPFDPDRVWQRMASGKITLFMAVPTIYARLIAAYDKADSAKQAVWSAGSRAMRLHVSGSAALPVPVLERWEAITGQRLLERYGMTEIGMALSNPYRGERRPGFVGQPLPGMEVRRRNESGGPVRDEEPGEIEVRGENVFLEYWNRPEETTASFRDGWFRTGDIAIVENGAYRILGRNSVDIIKTGGYKVSALEIEDVLRTHPDIRDCAVVGVPDDEWGERVALCAVAEPTLDLTALREWGKERLAPYKVPSLLCVSPDLPRNAMGKVQKHLVRALFEQS